MRCSIGKAVVGVSSSSFSVCFPCQCFRGPSSDVSLMALVEICTTHWANVCIGQPLAFILGIFATLVDNVAGHQGGTSLE